MKNTLIQLFMLCYIFIGFLSCKLNEETSPNILSDFREGLFVRSLDTVQLEILNKGRKDFPNVSIIKIVDDTSAIQFYEKINMDSIKREVHRINEQLKESTEYIQSLEQQDRSSILTYRTTAEDSVYFIKDMKYAQIEFFGRLVNSSIELKARFSSSTNMYDPENNNTQAVEFEYYH